MLTTIVNIMDKEELLKNLEENLKLKERLDDRKRRKIDTNQKYINPESQSEKKRKYFEKHQINAKERINENMFYPPLWNQRLHYISQLVDQYNLKKVQKSLLFFGILFFTIKKIFCENFF